VLADNDPAEQEKLIKLNTLLANLVIFHNFGDLGRPPDRGQAYSRRPVSNPPLRYLGLAPFLRAA
jgi:hypothetical protein